MPISNTIIHVSDVMQATKFYESFLGGVVLGEPTVDAARLDFVTATIELLRTESTVPPTWQEGDLHAGFRHLGFKVADIDQIVSELKAAGAVFWLDPLESTMAGVKIAFFFDSDGTIIELVQRHLQYQVIYDQGAVDQEHAMPVPSRPRFDHVGLSTHNLLETEDFYRGLGFTRVGAFVLHNDLGARFDYLRGGDTVIEVFSFDVETLPNPVRLDTLGFVAVEMPGDAPENSLVVGHLADGRRVLSDPDGLGLVLSIARVLP